MQKSQRKFNMNRVRLIIVSSFILLMAVGLSARAENPDYGNDANSAEPIDPNGTIVEGTVSPTGDEDWFSFTATAEGLYEIALWSQSGNKYIRVYGLDEYDEIEEITYFNASSGTKINDIFIEQRYAGTCYLKVYSGSGIYHVSVNEVGIYDTDAYPNTCADAALFNVDDPPPYDGITNWGLDEDWLTFNTIALHMYEITLSRAYNSDVVYGLYADDCATSLRSSSSASITFVSWYGADRNLRLHSSSFNKEGYYEILVDDLGEQPDDHGNTYDVATPINTIGDPCEGNVQYAATLGSDEDWFSFTATAEGLYEIALWSQSGNKYIRVYGLDEYDEIEEITYFNASSGTKINDIFIEQRYAGTCYLKVYSGSGIYHVSVNEVGIYDTDAYPNTCADAALFNVDDPPPYDGITNWGLDEDWLTFNTIALHMYEITLSRAYNSDVVYGLYADDCATSLRSSSSASITFVSWYGADRNLRLHSSSFNKEGYYEILVDDLGEQPDDHGNTYDVATPISTIGDPCEGNLQYTATLGSDEDWFSFTATAEADYEIALWSQSGNKYVRVYGLNESDELEEITYFNASSTTTTKSIFIEQRLAGTCYLKVYSGSGLYQVSVVSPEPQCGDATHPYPTGDTNLDCVVNFLDVATLVNNWLQDNRP